MTEEGVQEPIAEVQEAAQPQPSDKEINFQRLREKMEQIERENYYLKTQFQQSPQSKEMDKDVSEDDIPTFGDLKKIRERDMQEIGQLKQMLQELDMKARHSDYNETVKEYLPDILKEEPDLALALKDNPMMHRLAYKLAQASPRYHQEKLAKKNAETVEKMVTNATKATPATARKNVVVQDEEAKLTSMSDQQIRDMFNMAKARY